MHQLSSDVTTNWDSPSEIATFLSLSEGTHGDIIKALRTIDDLRSFLLDHWFTSKQYTVSQSLTDIAIVLNCFERRDSVPVCFVTSRAVGEFLELSPPKMNSLRKDGILPGFKLSGPQNPRLSLPGIGSAFRANWHTGGDSNSEVDRALDLLIAHGRGYPIDPTFCSVSDLKPTIDIGPSAAKQRWKSHKFAGVMLKTSQAKRFYVPSIKDHLRRHWVNGSDRDLQFDLDCLGLALRSERFRQAGCVLRPEERLIGFAKAADQWLLELPVSQFREKVQGYVLVRSLADGLHRKGCQLSSVLIDHYPEIGKRDILSWCDEHFEGPKGVSFNMRTLSAEVVSISSIHEQTRWQRPFEVAVVPDTMFLRDGGTPLSEQAVVRLSDRFKASHIFRYLLFQETDAGHAHPLYRERVARLVAPDMRIRASERALLPYFIKNIIETGTS